METSASGGRRRAEIPRFGKRGTRQSGTSDGPPCTRASPSEDVLGRRWQLGVLLLVAALIAALSGCSPSETDSGREEAADRVKDSLTVASDSLRPANSVDSTDESSPSRKKTLPRHATSDTPPRSDGRVRSDRPGKPEIRSLKVALRAISGRAIVGFKPSDAASGLTEDGNPRLTPEEVRKLVARFQPSVIRDVRRIYDLLPAAAVRLDPDKVDSLLASPHVDYVEPDKQVELMEPGGR